LFFLLSEAHLNYCTAPESKQISMMHTPWTTLARKPCSSLGLAKEFVSRSVGSLHEATKPLYQRIVLAEKDGVGRDAHVRDEFISTQFRFRNN
jgi:hypothetical protein